MKTRGTRSEKECRSEDQPVGTSRYNERDADSQSKNKDRAKMGTDG
ncbi:MAG TPA: hypothetical protein VF939_11685 [Puia sp.]